MSLQERHEELIKSEKYFRTIFNLAAVGMAQVDPATGKFQIANAKMEEITGYSLAELWNLTFSDLTHPEDRQKDLAGYRAMLEGKTKTYATEKRYIRKDGRVIWVSINVAPVRDASGTIIHTVGVIQDITARVEAERMLKETLKSLQDSEGRLKTSEAQLGLVTDSLPVLVSYVDSSERYCFVNAAYEKWYSHYRGKILGKTLQAFLGQEAYQAIHPYVKRALAGEALQFETQRTYAGVGLKSVEVNYIPDFSEDGKVRGFVVLIHDITARKEAEERASFLADTTSVLSESLDVDTVMKRVTARAVPHIADWVIVSVVRDDRSVRRIAFAISDPTKEQRVEEILKAVPADTGLPYGSGHVLQTGKTQLIAKISEQMTQLALEKYPQLEYVFKEVKPISTISVPLKTTHGRNLGVMTFVTTEHSGRSYDPSDLALIEEFARRCTLAMENAMVYREVSTTLHARDEFLSIASHELKTPITALRLQLQLARRALRTNLPSPPPEELIKVFDMSLKQVDSLTDLINDLLDISRVRLGRLALTPVEMNLSNLVREITGRFSEQLIAAKCPLELKLEESLVGRWDRRRIEQVIVNLISNAIKYAPGGAIELTTSRSARGAVITIADHGPGISRENQERVFDRFERGAATIGVGGLGLGLFIVKRIVEAHHGSIRLESDVGRGSKFTIELPFTARHTIANVLGEN